MAKRITSKHSSTSTRVLNTKGTIAKFHYLIRYSRIKTREASFKTLK